MIRYTEYLNKNVRVISVVIFRNGRTIKTEYFGKLIKENKFEIILLEKDNVRITINKKHIKRVDEHGN